MGTIVLLGLAAAVYPQLLAVVLLILTLPNPRRLLWVCCASSLLVSVGANTAIFAVFRARGTIGGTSEDRLGPLAYLGIGVVAVALAALIGTTVGRDFMNRRRPRRRTPGGNPGKVGVAMSGLRGRADNALRDGSLIVAAITGAFLAMPGPFDVLAVGHLARGHHTAVAAFWAIVVFALIKFALIEVPSVAYAIDPDGTADRVTRVSGWMQTNKLVTAAGLVGLVGVLFIGRGVLALV